ncbi:hypothetical protein AZH11_08530 [Pseudomonas simiae]|nr:hypothetical protein AZH11_08530 [Pseudomonas simiae]
MKKEIIAFDFDASVLNDMFSSLGVSAQVEFDDVDIVSFNPASEDEWENYASAYSGHFHDFMNVGDYIDTKLKIINFEKAVVDFSIRSSSPVLASWLHKLYQLEKDIEFFFSEANPYPLSVYPLFARWFTVCALLNAKELHSRSASCLECVSFWKISKDYLDKSLVYLISHMKVEMQGQKDIDGKIISELKKLCVFKNYRLLSAVRGAIDVKDHSLVKREALLSSDTFVDKAISELLNN